MGNYQSICIEADQLHLLYTEIEKLRSKLTFLTNAGLNKNDYCVLMDMVRRIDKLIDNAIPLSIVVELIKKECDESH